MTTDADLSLENEHLDQYLETAPPEPPVVVVQYRNRGIPAWIFFALLVAVPVASIAIYHRLVVANYRAQQAEAARVLETWIDVPRPTAPVASQTVPALTSVAGQPAAASAKPTAAVPTAPPVSAPAVAAPTSPPQVLAGADTAPRDAPANETVAESGEKQPPRLRSILPNPFADGGAGQRRSARAGDAADTGRDQTSDLGNGQSREVAPANPKISGPSRATTGGQEDRSAAEERKADAAPGPPRQIEDAQPDPPGLKPLPTKEESLREIQEEAEKKRAELFQQHAIRAVADRAKRHEERVTFRQELRAALALHGNAAGPEIDKLSKRYGYDTDMARFERADWIWRMGRYSRDAKVQFIRALDLPEAVILDFLSNDVYRGVRTRHGPRDQSEARVRAAFILLTYELPGEVPMSPSQGGAAPKGSSSQTPARRGDQAAAPPR
jgi:hypothetical protein